MVLLALTVCLPAFAGKKVDSARIISLFQKLNSKQVLAIRKLKFDEYTAIKHLWKRPSYKIWFNSEIAVIMGIKARKEVEALSEWELNDILELDDEEVAVIRKLSSEQVEAIQDKSKDLDELVREIIANNKEDN